MFSFPGDWGMQNCSSVRNPGVLYKVPGVTPLAGENVSKSQAPMGPSSPQGHSYGHLLVISNANTGLINGPPPPPEGRGVPSSWFS